MRKPRRKRKKKCLDIFIEVLLYTAKCQLRENVEEAAEKVKIYYQDDL